MSLNTITENTNAASLSSMSNIKAGKITENVIENHQADASQADKSAMGLANDFNNFVKMLVSQLKNQDPTNPMESNEFTQQIVAFTGVEQAVAANKHLEKLVKLNEGSQFKEAANLVGKIVSYDSSKSKLVKDQPVSFSYNLMPRSDQKIETAIVKIFNSEGLLIKEMQGSTLEGSQLVKWNGVDFRGKKSPEGDYHIKVYAVDSEGKPVTVGPSIVTGFVSETRFRNGIAYLVVDGKEVPLSRISGLQAMKPVNNIPNNLPSNNQNIAPDMNTILQEALANDPDKKLQNNIEN